jgi:hypothetical protein
MLMMLYAGDAGDVGNAGDAGMLVYAGPAWYSWSCKTTPIIIIYSKHARLRLDF